MTDFSAVLWDLDGTLVDTEPLWMAGEREMADARGVTWTDEDELALVGNSLIESGRYIKKRLGSDLEPEAIVEELVGRLAAALTREIPWRPGARELVSALEEEGVPQALVTMSYAPIAAPVAAVLPFRAVVTGDRVEHGKPHPEAYLRAAELLGLAAGDCLAVEDSAKGAASANAAGCLVLAVPHYVSVPEAPNRVARATLAGLTPADLRDLH